MQYPEYVLRDNILYIVRKDGRWHKCAYQGDYTVRIFAKTNTGDWKFETESYHSNYFAERKLADWSRGQRENKGKQIFVWKKGDPMFTDKLPLA